MHTYFDHTCLSFSSCPIWPQFLSQWDPSVFLHVPNSPSQYPHLPDMLLPTQERKQRQASQLGNLYTSVKSSQLKSANYLKKIVGKLTETDEWSESWECKVILLTHLWAQLYTMCEVEGWFYTSLNQDNTKQDDLITNNLFLLRPCTRIYGLVAEKNWSIWNIIFILKEKKKLKT